jgi:hydroxymethylbilane synthase
MTQKSRPKLSVGTRGSPLALAQTHAVCDLLRKAHGFGQDDIEVCIIKTTGDTVQDRRLAEIGGKGLFTKEIEIALAAKEIDLAVHSSKDMPTVLPQNLILTAFLEREDPRDVLICEKAKTLQDLPRGATLGTASLRREAQVRRLRPDLNVQALRGNVETRLRKVSSGELDATILGMAGLKRLGLVSGTAHVLSPEHFLPAVGQGAVVIEAREDDAATRGLLAKINHADTSVAVTAERGFLAVLEGSCRTPIAGYATVESGMLHFKGIVLRPDGSDVREVARSGSPSDALKIGMDAGQELKSRLPEGFLALH